MKILLISGHGANDPGACSNYGTESVETRKVTSELINQFSKYNVQIDLYPTSRNCYDDVCNGRVQVNFSQYDYIFEVHFNSASASAYGTEIWVTPEENGTAVEQNIVNNIAKLGLANRGVKSEHFAVINYAKNKCGVSSALIETCFISNSGDMAIYNNKFKEICKAMVDGIVSGFGITAKSTTQPEKPNNEEEDEMKGIVVYTYELDGHIARWLAYNLKYEVESASTKKDYSGYKEVICIGGDKGNYTSYCTKFIAGADRYQTVKEVLKYLGKL